MLRVCFCHTVLSFPCNLEVTCWERADLLVLLCVMFSLICHFPIWCPGLGVVRDCIDTWSLHSSLFRITETAFNIHNIAH